MYQPMLMSKETFDRADSDEQQEVLMRAAKKAEVFFAEEAKGLDDEAERAFREAGVEVVHLDESDLRRVA